MIALNLLLMLALMSSQATMIGRGKRHQNKGFLLMPTKQKSFTPRRKGVIDTVLLASGEMM